MEVYLLKRYFSIIAVCVFLGLFSFTPHAQSYYSVDQLELFQSDTSEDTDGDDSVYTELENRLLEAWDSHKTSVRVADLNLVTRNIGNIYFDILEKHPEYFYVYSGMSYSQSDGYVKYITIKYNINNTDTIHLLNENINAEADEIMSYISDDMTDFEKVITVHDYMVLNYEYDTSNTNHTLTVMTTKKRSCRSICQGFLLCNE